MARGMVVGETPTSQAQTENWDEHYDATFAKRDTRKGRFVCRPGHPKANALGFVHVDDLGDWTEQSRTDALAAPVMVDRFMEGQKAQDGTDIGSRRKRRAYMSAHGLADSSDYSDRYREQRKAQREQAEAAKRDEVFKRAVYEVERKRR